MYSFTNDYSEGAHPRIIEAIVKTNMFQTAGYSHDEFCLEATNTLKKITDNQNIDVHYLVGGTQTNLIMISSALRSHQAVISADTGHIAVHETGSVEATGHKVIIRPHVDGKLTPDMIVSVMEEHQSEHMVRPKMAYISQTTEYGTVYTKEELEALYACCKEYDLYLFIDGARLGSALALSYAPTLKEMASLCDAFYIGGTKLGALFGECLVIINDALKPDFKFHIKQKGGLLAKGRLLGIQFLELFSNDLYTEIGRYENEMASMLRQGFIENGYTFYIDSPSNQLFPIISNDKIEELEKEFSFMIMHKIDADHTCVRLVTSFATKKEMVEKFVSMLKK